MCFSCLCCRIPYAMGNPTAFRNSMFQFLFKLNHRHYSDAATPSVSSRFTLLISGGSCQNQYKLNPIISHVFVCVCIHASGCFFSCLCCRIPYATGNPAAFRNSMFQFLFKLNHRHYSNAATPSVCSRFTLLASGGSCQTLIQIEFKSWLGHCRLLRDEKE